MDLNPPIPELSCVGPISYVEPPLFEPSCLKLEHQMTLSHFRDYNNIVGDSDVSNMSEDCTCNKRKLAANMIFMAQTPHIRTRFLDDSPKTSHPYNTKAQKPTFNTQDFTTESKAAPLTPPTGGAVTAAYIHKKRQERRKRIERSPFGARILAHRYHRIRENKDDGVNTLIPLVGRFGRTRRSHDVRSNISYDKRLSCDNGIEDNNVGGNGCGNACLNRLRSHSDPFGYYPFSTPSLPRTQDWLSHAPLDVPYRNLIGPLAVDSHIGNSSNAPVQYDSRPYTSYPDGNKKRELIRSLKASTRLAPDEIDDLSARVRENLALSSNGDEAIHDRKQDYEHESIGSLSSEDVSLLMTPATLEISSEVDICDLSTRDKSNKRYNDDDEEKNKDNEDGNYEDGNYEGVEVEENDKELTSYNSECRRVGLHQFWNEDPYVF